jgi:transposase
MSDTERDRLRVLAQIGRGGLTQRQAAGLVGLSARQVRRLQARQRAEGDRGLIHRARGRPSNRRIPDQVERRAKALLADKYGDFGPTLASEHLAEDDGIVLSRETVRRFMHEEHLFARRRKSRPHRRRRQRRACFGELLQMDASPHDWFEGRGPRCVLLDIIDDATSRRMLRFLAADTAEDSLEMIGRWIRAFGRPRAFYVDHANHLKPLQQRGKRPSLSQVERALGDLDIGLIGAHSPQAKGRVERAHGLDQDRLIKEMRLRGLSTIEQANEFLEQVYVPRMNARFAVKPRWARDGHRSARRFDLEAILCPHETRRVMNDHTVSIDAVAYQIEPNGRSLAGQTVTVERRLDGTVRLRAGKRHLIFQRAVEMGTTRRPASRPPRCPQFHSPGDDDGDGRTSAAPQTRPRRRPAADHPSKRTFLSCQKADISTLR